MGLEIIFRMGMQAVSMWWDTIYEYIDIGQES